MDATRTRITKKLIVPMIASVLAFPGSTFACNGSITCAMRQAPRQVAEMLPGFLSSHAGLLIGMALGALFVGVSLSRQAQTIADKDRSRD